MDKEIFVQNIKRQCSLRGVKPTIACRESGAGADLINQIERRGSVPSVERVQLLASYLGVTVSELLGETPPEDQARAAGRIVQKEKPIPVSENGLSKTALRVAKAYDQAGPGIQESIRKLLDVEDIPKESGHTSEAM